MMKFNQILPVIAIYVVALGGCSNTTPDYSEFYKDPETVKEEDPSLMIIKSKSCRSISGITTMTKIRETSHGKLVRQLLFR